MANEYKQTMNLPKTGFPMRAGLSKVTCETFIPGFSGDLYGTDPVVEFYAYLSPSKKFDTLDELRDCINHAARRAQEYFQ